MLYSYLRNSHFYQKRSHIFWFLNWAHWATGLETRLIIYDLPNLWTISFHYNCMRCGKTFPELDRTVWRRGELRVDKIKRISERKCPPSTSFWCYCASICMHSIHGDFYSPISVWKKSWVPFNWLSSQPLLWVYARVDLRCIYTCLTGCLCKTVKVKRTPSE